MEILNTIWTALTTENEMLTNILFMPFMFIEMLITMLLFLTILKIVSTKKQKISYVFILSIIGNLTNTFVPKPYNTSINVLICLVSIMCIFN